MLLTHPILMPGRIVPCREVSAEVGVARGRTGTAEMGVAHSAEVGVALFQEVGVFREVGVPHPPLCTLCGHLCGHLLTDC